VLRDVASVLISIANDGNNVVPTRDFVVLEPIVKRLRNARTVFLDVGDSVDERRDRVVYIDYQDFPICFTAVVGCDTAQDFRLSDLTKVAWVLPDVEEVDGVVVAGLVDEGVVDVGVFPCLGDLGNWWLVWLLVYDFWYWEGDIRSRRRRDNSYAACRAKGSVSTVSQKLH
jgi:hypothetical protein